MEDWLKPYVCTQCGGRVNRTTMTCEMCGTQFKEQDNVLWVIAERPGVHTLGQVIAIDKEMALLQPKEVSAIVMEQMTRELAKCIAPFIEMEIEDEPVSCQKIVRGKVRILDSAFRFRGEG